MKQVKRTQDKELAQLVRKECEEYGLKDYAVIERHAGELSMGFSSTKFKIMFICFNFSQDEKLANRMLMDLIPESDVDELVVIFDKINDFSEEFLEQCKLHARVKKLRPIIAKILKKLRITCEDAHVYFFEDMEEDERTSCIKRLFKTVNTLEFKNTKDVIVPMLEQYKALLPDLNESGYKNLRQVGMLGLFRDQFSCFHRSEVVRVEHFLGLDSFCEIYSWLYFNQFIYDSENVKIVRRSFMEKVKFLAADAALFPAYCDLLYARVVRKMCQSPNMYRRQLGVTLLSVLFDYFPNMPDKSLLLALIYDVSSEVRKMAARFRDVIHTDLDVHFDNLVVPENNMIDGASIILQDIDPEAPLLELNKRIAADDEMVFGLLHCLNYMKHTSCRLTQTVMGLYEKYKDFDSERYTETIREYYWNILKECCIYFKQIGREDVLMNTLLLVDHLGLVCLIKDIVTADGLDVVELANKGINEILVRNTTVRKSGGLSQYFVLLYANPTNRKLLRETLFDLIATLEGSRIELKDVRKSVLFHTLNIFGSLLEEYREDELFYLMLGFACLRDASFCVKNCGFVLLGTLFKKILIPQKTFDVFFLSRKAARRYVSGVLLEAIANKDPYSMFFVLFMFRNTNVLNSVETDLVARCVDVGEFITLEAKGILSGVRRAKVEEWTPTPDGFPEGPPAKILTALLIRLNRLDPSARAFICDKYGIEEGSFEWLIHRAVEKSKELGCAEEIKTNLMNYQMFAREDVHACTVYGLHLDLSFVIELLDYELCILRAV